jgi:hypothetical protein
VTGANGDPTNPHFPRRISLYLDHGLPSRDTGLLRGTIHRAALKR